MFQWLRKAASFVISILRILMNMGVLYVSRIAMSASAVSFFDSTNELEFHVLYFGVISLNTYEECSLLRPFRASKKHTP